VYIKGHAAESGTEVLGDDDYQVIETIPAADKKDEVDQSLDQYFPKREKIPKTKVSSGSLFNNRIWTCLVSVVIVAIALSAITVGMFKCIEKEDEALEKAGIDDFSTSTRGYKPLKLPTLTGFSERLDELAHQANDAIEELDGLEASRILDDHDNLYEVKELTDALDQIRKPDTGTEKPIKEKPEEQDREDASTEPMELSEDATSEIFPATIAALKQLRDYNRLESGLSADLEITGTVLSLHTNLPESTKVDVEVRIPGQRMTRYQPLAIKGIIRLPAFDYLPVGTFVIHAQILPLIDQPRSVQFCFVSSQEFQPEYWGFQLQITLEQTRSATETPTLEASVPQITGLMANDGLNANASIPDIGLDVRAPLVIEGESKDPFLFLKSAVQASGSITQAVNDPAPWVLIRVNKIEYWIESYYCREAVRNYASSDQELSEYVLNHIYCL
jgi:hypothetical protein